MGAPTDRTASWRPVVAGIAEVFHAHWHDHAYPGHTHDTWTLLVVDDGFIGYPASRVSAQPHSSERPTTLE